MKFISFSQKKFTILTWIFPFINRISLLIFMFTKINYITLIGTFLHRDKSLNNWTAKRRDVCELCKIAPLGTCISQTMIAQDNFFIASNTGKKIAKHPSSRNVFNKANLREWWTEHHSTTNKHVFLIHFNDSKSGKTFFSKENIC